MQDKRPLNEKMDPHGYWEIYWLNGKLNKRVRYINGAKFGKEESFHTNGKIWTIVNYINSERHGYEEFHWSTGQIDKEYYAR